MKSQCGEAPNQRATPDEVAAAFWPPATWRVNPKDPHRIDYYVGDEIIGCDRADAFARRPAERDGNL